jgi:hypothetical protein
MSRCSPGTLRQFDAVLGTRSLLGYSRAITAPTVVLHGSADPMVRPRRRRGHPRRAFRRDRRDGTRPPQPVWRPIIEALTENFALTKQR